MNENDENRDQDIPSDEQLQRLPLWRGVVDEMLVEGIEFGRVFTATYFELRLKCDRSTVQYGRAISKIRRALEKHGRYLTGRGFNGNQFVIQPTQNNQKTMASYQRKAIDALKRGVILGTATPLSELSPEDRRRHESILEKMAMRTVLVCRSSAVAKVLAKNAPKLLKAG